MSNPAAPERASDHPLFRALVLMGGSLALGCGGSAVIDAGAGGSSGARAVGGAGQAGHAPGGSAAQSGAAGAIGTITTGGGGGSGVVDAGPPDCPPAQWDCSGLGATCDLYLGNAASRPAGCVCDPKRPRSVADCGSNEDLICQRAYTDQPDPTTWDTFAHIQCACVPGPSVPSYDTCGAACTTTYPALAGQGGEACSLAQGTSCDPSGTCTATAADVLRQDGIVCGCAPVGLK